MKKKVLLLALAAVILVAGSIGGTLAWFIDSASVTNTFTVGHVVIEASEPEWNKADADHKLVPGKTLIKDPTVTVKQDSEKAYVFFKVTMSSNMAAVVTYTPASGWETITGRAGIYYRIVDTSDTDVSFPAFENNLLAVSTAATQADLSTISSDTMRISFAAVQYEGMDDSVETALGKLPAGF